MMKIHFILAVITFLIFTGCDKSCDLSVEVTSQRSTVTIERLEEELFTCNSLEDVLAFLARHEVLKVHFLGSEQYPNDTILAQNLLGRIRNPHLQTLLEEARSEFGDMTDIREEFENALAYIRNFDPEFPSPRIQTLVTGFGSSEMIVSDTLIIIGLDFYIGPGASYRPNGYPDYILSRFQKEYIVPAAVLILSDKYIETDFADQTMLADMVYYGKKYHFAKEMMPCTSDSLIIWYTGQQLSDVDENRQIIWANFIQNELLYKTNHIDKEKFLGERPNTYEISAVCPGRIGAWLGWEIVNEYVKRNPEVELEDLLQDKDAQKIFSQSKFRG